MYVESEINSAHKEERSVWITIENTTQNRELNRNANSKRYIPKDQTIRPVVQSKIVCTGYQLLLSEFQ